MHPTFDFYVLTTRTERKIGENVHRFATTYAKSYERIVHRLIRVATKILFRAHGVINVNE